MQVTIRRLEEAPWKVPGILAIDNIACPHDWAAVQ